MMNLLRVPPGLSPLIKILTNGTEAVGGALAACEVTMSTCTNLVGTAMPVPITVEEFVKRRHKLTK